MRVAFRTLGCKVNQVETEQMKEDFLARGYELVDFTREADVYIINTCTVTHISDRKSRALIRRAIRNNPSATIAAVGCMAQVNADQLAGIEGLNLVVGNSDKEHMADIIEEYLADGSHVCKIFAGPMEARTCLKAGGYTMHHQRTRGFIKIQDGCENYCSYCIVPYTRGPVRSKKPADVLMEIEQMLALGYRELVLTGIHTGLYGHDIPDWDIGKLLKEIFARIKGRYRIRLSSIEPLEVSKTLIEVAASEPAFCRHLHIPLQSGSDNILRAMNRGYDSNYYKKMLNEISAQITDIALTTDIMVGFPTESESDFMQSVELLQELPVYDLHVFQYSLRRGTDAALMSPQVNESEKQRRSQLLINMARHKKNSFIKGLGNREMEVLVEKKIGPDLYQGLSDNYVQVELRSLQEITGQFVNVVLGVNGIPVYKTPGTADR
ncbi:miab family protein [hydrocarbon metagenome]|uniref:Miab family protein n=1 Tax=hydrocarbon metagenome TaxID=938273 RepID=A0A0W8E6U4_9ZZZZ